MQGGAPRAGSTPAPCSCARALRQAGFQRAEAAVNRSERLLLAVHGGETSSARAKGGYQRPSLSWRPSWCYLKIKPSVIRRSLRKTSAVETVMQFSEEVVPVLVKSVKFSRMTSLIAGSTFHPLESRAIHGLESSCLHPRNQNKFHGTPHRQQPAGKVERRPQLSLSEHHILPTCLTDRPSWMEAFRGTGAEGKSYTWPQRTSHYSIPSTAIQEAS
ncbi:uncharacterized protein [Macaca nemestrina]|uniref:uncharacterized protein n=1 Tax=Macaca nemestrina TaxID=9545 RepID=UPI0039B84D1C